MVSSITILADQWDGFAVTVRVRYGTDGPIWGSHFFEWCRSYGIEPVREEGICYV